MKYLLGLLAFTCGFVVLWLGFLAFEWFTQEMPDLEGLPTTPLAVEEVNPVARIHNKRHDTRSWMLFISDFPKGPEHGSKIYAVSTPSVPTKEIRPSPVKTFAPPPRESTAFSVAAHLPVSDMPSVARTSHIGSFSGVLTSLMLWGALGPPQAAETGGNVMAVPVPPNPTDKPAPAPAEQPARFIPQNAVELALADAKSIGPEVAKQRRYLWCPNKSQEEHVAAAFTINSAISQSSVDIHPIILADGYLVAVDLKLCAGSSTEQYDRISGIWEKYANEEPYFHVPGRFKVSVKPYKSQDGKTYDFQWKDGFVRAPHLGQAIIDLETVTGSYCPILRVDQWLVRSLDTVDGGLYYDLRGLEVGKTKLDEYLVSRGASREQAKRIRADEKAIFISEVTDKARVVTMFPTGSTRLSVGIGVASITDDPFDETDQADFDPFRNFLDSRTNGHEVFVTLSSGWIEYTIWDAAGNLVAEAPPNLVADHRIPEPHTRRLQGAISCIRCHGPKEMWQPFTNEVAMMIGQQANVIGEVKAKNKQAEALERLAGLFSGDLTDVLIQARNGFSKRVFAVTRKTVPEATASVTALYNHYVFDRVTAKTACLELGVTPSIDDELGVLTFRQLVPPLDSEGLGLDDPVIGRLHISYVDLDRKAQRGLALTRRQWEIVFADAMNRSLK